MTSTITYDSSASTTDNGYVDEYAMLNDTALVPSEVIAMYPPADVTIPLVVFFDTMDDGASAPSPTVFLFPFNSPTLRFRLLTVCDMRCVGTNHAMFNDITYNSPLVPGVLSELTLGDNATVSAAYGQTNYVWNHLDVIDIVVMNSDAGKHPLCVPLSPSVSVPTPSHRSYRRRFC